MCACGHSTHVIEVIVIRTHGANDSRCHSMVCCSGWEVTMTACLRHARTRRQTKPWSCHMHARQGEGSACMPKSHMPIFIHIIHGYNCDKVIGLFTPYFWRAGAPTASDSAANSRPLASLIIGAALKSTERSSMDESANRTRGARQPHPERTYND